MVKCTILRVGGLKLKGQRVSIKDQGKRLKAQYLMSLKWKSVEFKVVGCMYITLIGRMERIDSGCVFSGLWPRSIVL